MIPCLEAACDAGEIIDFQQVLRHFTFDNICSVAFGVDSEDLVGKSSFVEAFDYAVERSSERFMIPVQMVWKLMRFFNIGSERKYREAIKVIDEFAMDVIRFKEKKWEMKEGENDCRSEDLLSRFMGSTLDFGFEDQHEKRKFLRDIVISFILAGKDSTATALTWFFWLMSGHPRCKHLIYKELSSAVPESKNWLENLKYEELKRSHYLQAALSETLRLFPPVPINSRLTLREDVLPDGARVGKGWFADYSAYAMGRIDRLWGSDCREYKPERWLDSDGVYQPVDQFKFPVFHCGPRMCLGKEMANVQMKAIAAAVMNVFDVEVVDGGGCASRMNDPPYTLSLLLKMKGGLNVRLKRRDQEK